MAKATPSAEKLKYDVLRNFLRTELAKRANGFKSFSTADIHACLESVREKEVADLQALAKAAATKRAAIRSMTGCNGETPTA